MLRVTKYTETPMRPGSSWAGGWESIRKWCISHLCSLIFCLHQLTATGRHKDSEFNGSVWRPTTAAALMAFILNSPLTGAIPFPNSLLLELDHMRHWRLCLHCTDQHFFCGENSVLASTAILLLWEVVGVVIFWYNFDLKAELLFLWVLPFTGEAALSLLGDLSKRMSLLGTATCWGPSSEENAPATAPHVWLPMGHCLGNGQTGSQECSESSVPAVQKLQGGIKARGWRAAWALHRLYVSAIWGWRARKCSSH